MKTKNRKVIIVKDGDIRRAVKLILWQRIASVSFLKYWLGISEKSAIGIMIFLGKRGCVKKNKYWYDIKIRKLKRGKFLK